MRVPLAKFCESVLLTLVRLLLPTQGRHRAAMPQPPDREHPLTPPPHSPPVRPHHPLHALPFELDTPLVRPYLFTPEERRDYTSPRHIHGVEVSA
ncbi:hypothetical protein [Streptomyces sp. NPDC002845]